MRITLRIPSMTLLHIAPILSTGVATKALPYLVEVSVPTQFVIIHMILFRVIRVGALLVVPFNPGREFLKGLHSTVEFVD